MNVWRLGTNWGGTPTLDVILATKVGFFYKDWTTDGVEIDDIIAIATPGKYTVEAVGIAASRVQPLSKLLNQQEQAGALSQWVDDAKGFRFKKIWNIPKEIQFSTSDYKQFYSLRNDPDAWNNAIKLINLMQSEEKMKELCQLLNNCHNLILTGAPGTGKSFLAKKIAQAMTGDDETTPAEQSHIGFVQFHPSYDYTDFVEGLRPTASAALGEKCNIGFGLEDGTFKSFCRKAITASPNNGQDNFDSAWKQLVDTLKEKQFLKIANLSNKGELEIELNEDETGLASRTYASDAEKASHNWINGGSKFFSKDQLYNVYRGLPGVPKEGHDNYRKAVIKTMEKDFGLLEYKAAGVGKNYVFIIDEINRGDIAKIFGELFFALDPGYRGETGRVETQYNNLIDKDDIFKAGFYIPQNVYIIGTMNDIDRNVESMDFAIRRRFTWKKITPEDTQDVILSGLEENTAIEAKKRMDSLNKAIRAEEPQLGENFCIGAAYLKKVDDFMKVDDTQDKWKNLWDYHLNPLLEEYVRGLPDANKMLKKFEDAYNGKAQDDANTNIQG